MEKLTLRVLHPRLPVPHPEDEKSCYWGSSLQPLPAGGALRPGHHSGEEVGAGMVPSSPSKTRDLPAWVKWEGASPWGVQQPRAHPWGYPGSDGCFVLGGREGAPPPVLTAWTETCTRRWCFPSGCRRTWWAILARTLALPSACTWHSLWVVGNSLRPLHCPTWTWTAPGHPSEHLTMRAGWFSAPRGGTPSLKGKGGGECGTVELSWVVPGATHRGPRWRHVAGWSPRRIICTESVEIDLYSNLCLYFNCIFCVYFLLFKEHWYICEKYTFRI